MENQDFRIDQKAVLLLVIGNILLIIFGAITRSQYLEFSNFILGFGLTLYFATWVIIISDMTKSNIYNKRFWIMSMFIIPGITQVFYLIQRNRLIRLGSKLSS